MAGKSGGGKEFLLWKAVSSKKQAEEVSPNVQEEMGRQHVAKWDGRVADVLEVAESRDIVLFEEAAAAIPAYAKLRDYIERGAIDVIVCYDLGRLGRAWSLIAGIVEKCRRANILIYELDNPPRDLEPRGTFDEILMRGFKAIVAQGEVMKTRDRMRFGREGRAKKGELPQVPPYGYYWEHKVVNDEISGLPLRTERHVAVDPEKAAVVRLIAELYLAGRGQTGIAAELTARGIRTPDGRPVWLKNSVLIILGRCWTYAGYAEYYRRRRTGYIRARGSWEPLWDEATAERIEQERASRAANRRIADTQSRLTGLVICDVCQKTMWQILNETGDRRDGYYDKRKHGGTTRYTAPRRPRFYCRPSHSGGYIGTNRIMAALAAAIEWVQNADLSAIPDEETDQVAHLAAQLAEHDATIARHLQGLRRADDAYVAGAMDMDRYKVQVDKLRAAIELEESAKTKVQAAADALRQRGSRVDLLREVAANGMAMLTTEDTAEANAWFRPRVRLFVRDNRVTNVIWAHW